MTMPMPAAADAPPETETPPAPNGVPSAYGELRSLEDAAVVKRVRELWESTDEFVRRKRAQWLANAARRRNMFGVRVVERKEADRHEFELKLPLGASALPPTMNKAARLCRRLKATIMADPPVPDVTPERDDPAARAAAQFTARLLQTQGAASGYNDLATARRAIDLACTFDSGFRHWWVDPTGGGPEPLDILASPSATTIDDATEQVLQVPQLDELGQPVLDEFGQPLLQEQRIPWGGELVRRYVAQDGRTLTDDPALARVRWRPQVRCDVHTGNNVRMYPATCTGIETATMAQVGELLPWAAIEKRWPAAAKLDEKQLLPALQDRPQSSDYLLHQDIEDNRTAKLPGSGRLNPACMGFVVTTYVPVCPEYPRGAKVVTLGKTVLLERGDWCDETRGYVRTLPIPVDQFKQFEEGRDDMYGVGLMTLLGSGNEARAQMLGYFFEHLERFSRRKVFYPLNSPIRPDEMGWATMGDYIPMAPGQGAPQTEDVPSFPQSAVEFEARISDEMDSESGLEAVAQGQNPTGVKSGLHAQQLIEQVYLGLSDIRQSTHEGVVRGWLISANLHRTFFTVPMTTRFVGVDNADREKEWRGADLDGFEDVRIQPGSGTMLTPSAKMAIAESAAQQGALSAQELRVIWRGAVGGTLGVQDEPHYARVRRQLARYAEGPTAEDDATIAAEAQTLWAPILADTLPAVAAMRLDELSRAMATAGWGQHPPAWVAAFNAEWQRMADAQQPQAPPAPQEGGEVPVAQT